MTTPAYIHFIGRRQGIIPYSNTNWFLEHSRNQELASIRNIPNIKIVNSKKKADIIFVRNKPELEETIPNVFQFKYPIKYWEKFYTTLVNKC